MKNGSSGRVGAREQTLMAIRSALKKTAPRKDTTAPGQCFLPVEGDLVERFRVEAAANHIDVLPTKDANESAVALKEVLRSLPAGEFFVQDTPELRGLIVAAAIAERDVRFSSQSGPAEASQATVSLCEALVASTGSILVSSGGCGGRGASIVAPCHVVVARADQVVADLQSAMACACKIAFQNSFIGLITGCSRTSDIEKKLVIGAHGPRRVVVILQSAP